MVHRPLVVRCRPHFQTWISLTPVGQSESNFMCSITRGEKRLHKVLGQIGSKLWFSWQLANLNQILCVASLGEGKSCIRFWGRLDQNSGFHGNGKPPLTYNRENDVSTFSRLFFFLSKSSFYLQITRTRIKCRTSSNFGQIGPLSAELVALERLKNPRLIMGKCCRHASLFMFDRIIIKVAGNQDRHKSSVEFDHSFWSYYLPLSDEKFTLLNLNILIKFYV